MITAAVIAVVVGSTSASATGDISPMSSRVPSQSDVAYAGDTDTAHRLDLYLPQATSGPFPLVVFVHGGAWSFGDKAMPVNTSYGTLRKVLAERGYAVASVRYRFVSRDPFPAQLHDVKAAIRFLRIHANRWGLDEKRFAVAGDSAGGQLALMAGLTGGGAGGDSLEGRVGAVEASSAVRAVVAYYPVTDLVRLFTDRTSAGCPVIARGPRSAEGRLVGGDPEAESMREAALNASPLSHAGQTRTPVLLMHGTTDCVVPQSQSRRMYAALRGSGTPVEMRLAPGGHSAPVFYRDPAMQGQVLDFLDRHLQH
ncbi:Acetyl esterase [Austwickia sp. TVS 96-490-7B]|nr:Acetyl esterase [Austwickia sp. TVS 96-490-7B]